MSKEREPSAFNECKGEAHYWILNDKNLGVCKRCGATKQFATERWVWQKRKVITSKNKATG